MDKSPNEKHVGGFHFLFVFFFSGSFLWLQTRKWQLFVIKQYEHVLTCCCTYNICLQHAYFHVMYICKYIFSIINVPLVNAFHYLFHLRAWAPLSLDDVSLSQPDGQPQWLVQHTCIYMQLILWWGWAESAYACMYVYILTFHISYSCSAC